jgi:hypothetical protein
MAGPDASRLLACRECGNPIPPGERALRVAYQILVVGATAEPLFVDDFCSPVCAVLGQLSALRHLQANRRIDELFNDEVSPIYVGRDHALADNALATLNEEQ